MAARLGYAARPAQDSPRSKLDSEVMTSDVITDLPASFTWEQWRERPGITMIAHLDISRLYFKPWQGRRTQQLTIVAVVRDSHGSFVAGKQSELQLSFRDRTFKQLAKTGFPVAMTIQVPPGLYSVRAVAQDAIEAKQAAGSSKVEIK